MYGHDWVTLIVAAFVAVVADARLARLVVDDDWPPMLWFRRHWDRILKQSSWSPLIECPFCVTPYFVAFTLAWAALSDLHWSWWLFHVWLAVAYLAAMLNVRDIPPEA